MNILKSPQGYRPPEAFFEGIQNNPQNNFQKVQKALGRGIVEGLGAVRNAVNGNVTIEIGFAFDYLGRVINVDADFVLDFSGITRPAAGSFRYVTAVADYNQIEEGAIQDDLGNSYWEEKQESIAIRFIEGDEAATEAAAVKPAVDSGDVVLVDMMFDNASSGCLSIDSYRRTFALFDKIFPIGFTYIQFPGDYDPSTLGYPGTWSNVSSELAGDFIRFEGGYALAFEAGEQDDAVMEHSHAIITQSQTGGASPFQRVGSLGTEVETNRINQVIDSTVSGESVKVDDYETRSINRTVRKWRRIL